MNIKNKLTVHSDGGSRGNPGHAAYGFTITDGEKEIFREGKYLGIQTNNFAEYKGVIQALDWIQKNYDTSEVSEIECVMDSQLVAEQLSGRWRVKNENIRNLFFSAKLIEKRIDTRVTYRSVPRAENKTADAIVNETLDKETL